MAKPAPPYRLRVPHDVAELLRGLHPGLKPKLKAALQAIQHDPHAGKPLREELAGLRSYRVSKFRVVYRVADDTTVELVAVGPRKSIYEETLRVLHREPR
ncbi:MAG: type II toxin-antitoxin system RelE family toxin [Deferrisomatales bacterium]